MFVRWSSREGERAGSEQSEVRLHAVTSPREKIAPEKKRVSYFSPLQLACFPVDMDIHDVPSTTWPTSEDSHSEVSVKSNDPPTSSQHPSPVTPAAYRKCSVVPFIWPEVEGQGHHVDTHTKQNVCVCGGGGGGALYLLTPANRSLIFYYLDFALKKSNLFVSS